jgi:hypothetical protein
MDWNLLTGTGRSRHKGSRQVFKMLILEEMFKNIFLVFNANPTPATLGYRRILYMVKILLLLFGPCFSWQSLRWHILYLTNPMMLQGLV